MKGKVMLPMVAGVAGLAIVSALAFKVLHHSTNTSSTGVATTYTSNNLVGTNQVNSNSAANDANTVNKASDIPNNTSDNHPNNKALNSANSSNYNHSTSRNHSTTNMTQQAPLDPGTLGQPVNSPAGPTPPAWSPISRVTVSAASNSVELGTPDQIVIQGYDKHGNPFNLSGQHVTYRVFGPNDGSAVSSTGEFLAKNASLYQIDALVDGVQSNLISVTVEPKTHPYTLTLTSSSNLVAGSSLQSTLMVHVVDVNGHDVQGAAVTFSDSNSSVVSISRTQRITDVNGMASVEATTATQSGGGNATITATVTGSGESANTLVLVNPQPAKIQLEGKVINGGYQMSYFLVKVEDAQGNGIPGIATKPTVTGGATVGANQYAFATDASGIVKIPVIFVNNSPIQATIDVMGTNVTWSGPVAR